MTSKWERFPPEFRPRLRLFLSADLVGSTAFKQAKRLHNGPSEPEDSETGPRWLVEMLSFYRNFTFELASSWARWKATAQTPPIVECACDPEFWKGNGDELLFTVELRHPKEVAGAIGAWIGAVRTYRASLRAKNVDLDVKSTAWLAGFPLANSELAFSRAVSLPQENLVGNDAAVDHFRSLQKLYLGGDEAKQLVRDFIGPSIDTGFRLSQLATSRRLVVSVDVAYVLSKYSVERPECAFRIGYDGKKQLKGVLGGRGYPIFWVDMSNRADIAALEDQLSGRQFPGSTDIRDYCSLFYQENEGRLVKPFIADCTEQEFAYEPAGYFEGLSRRLEILQKEVKRLEGEEAAIREQETAPSPADAEFSESLTAMSSESVSDQK